MKKLILNILIYSLFFGGVLLLMYPSLSNQINNKHQSSIITGYQQKVNTLSIEKRAEELEKAHQYNNNLLNMLSYMEAQEIEESSDYLSTLNIAGNGVMAILDIERINVHLPIYHTATDDVLQVAVGHLPESSLPVGGEGTHCILSAHTGLPSAKLFTDLDELEIGDMFKITVLGEVLVYQIDQIKVAEPYDTSDMRIFDGQDYVTLLTCTPYGINSHRLLVRGTRIDYEKAEETGFFAETDAVTLDKTMLLPFAIAPVLIIALLRTIALQISRKPSKKKSVQNGDEHT